MHTRSVRIEAFRCDDGTWELEAELDDVCPLETPLPSGARPAGESLHLMRLRVAFDADFDVVDVVAASDRVPYGVECEAAGPAYRKLIGLNLLRGFAIGLRERLGGIVGCTHLSELARFLPSVAVQAVAGDKLRRREMFETGDARNKRPFTLDGCHAWRSDGPVVERYMPMWYRPHKQAASEEESSVSRKEPS